MKLSRDAITRMGRVRMPTIPLWLVESGRFAADAPCCIEVAQVIERETGAQHRPGGEGKEVHLLNG